MAAQPDFDEIHTAANDNAPLDDGAQVHILREYKRENDCGGSLTRHKGRPAIVGCTVGGRIGTAYVSNAGGVVFEQSSAPIVSIDGRVMFLSESDVAASFITKYADELKFDHTQGAWHEWQGSHWKKCDTGTALDMARKLAHFVSASAKPKEIVATRRKSFAAGVEAFARVAPEMAVTIDAWDADPYLLGTPGGTVDLRTGILRPADQSDAITRVSGATPSATADCPRWIQFLDEATGSDADLIAFLKRWAGYCLTGEVKEHAVVFVYGSGGNGKSLFVNVLVRLAGDYATTAAMDTFTDSKSDKHPTDLARLAGARLVTASETEEGRSWAEARIKQMTGGDRIAARFMRQDFFEYNPQFKLLIIGNHLPRLHNVTDATRRRFNVVPFTIKPAAPDKDLESKLRVEAPGILRWAIEGCLEWQRDGLGQPPSVARATAEYFEGEDIFGQWLADSCRVERDNRNLWATTAELFLSWTSYATAAGEHVGTRKSFGERLRREGFEQTRIGDLRGVRGISAIRQKQSGGVES